LTDWEYIFTNSAKKYLKCLTLDNQKRIIKELQNLLIDPSLVDFKPLRGRPEARVRVGDYRIILRIEAENKRFVITQIGSRGDIYKG
jgi:mRNA interferase RelE/StbE